MILDLGSDDARSLCLANLRPPRRCSSVRVTHTLTQRAIAREGVVQTPLPMPPSVRAQRATTHVSAWFTTGRKSSNLGRKPDLGGGGSHSRARLAVAPYEPRSHDRGHVGLAPPSPHVVSPRSMVEQKRRTVHERPGNVLRGRQPPRGGLRDAHLQVPAQAEKRGYRPSPAAWQIQAGRAAP